MEVHRLKVNPLFLFNSNFSLFSSDQSASFCSNRSSTRCQRTNTGTCQILPHQNSSRFYPTTTTCMSVFLMHFTEYLLYNLFENKQSIQRYTCILFYTEVQRPARPCSTLQEGDRFAAHISKQVYHWIASPKTKFTPRQGPGWKVPHT